MGKKSKKKSKKKSNWAPPKGASAYFKANSDDDFKKAHPVGYFFLVLSGAVVLIAPMIIYGVYAISAFGDEWNAWFMLGVFGAMTVGFGLFNFLGVIIKQYLGHLVSILAFVIGGAMIAISLYFL